MVRSLVLVVLTLCAAGSVRAQDAGPPPEATTGPVDDEATPAAAEAQAPAATHDKSVATPDEDLLLEEIEFENRTYFRDETIRTFLLHTVPGPLDEDLLRADAARVEARYQERGFLQAKIAIEVKPTASLHGRKAIFHVDAGPRADLVRVHVVGNVDVDEASLKEGFFSRPPEPLGALTRAGFFHKPYLDQDAQRLVANYYKRGYLEARVLDTQVTADSDLDGLSVTMQVSEGPVYELAKLQLDGEAPEDADLAKLRALITVKDGEVADLVTIQQQADALLEPLRAMGHPFARFEQKVQVAAPPSGDPAHRAVILTLSFVRGPKPTVRTVKIVGNKGTQERVIRRDILVVENEPYDHAAVKRTERALMGTGFFQQVVARPVQTENPEIIDVEVTVVEQQTWIFSIAPAFDTTAGGEGLIGVGILADRNFLGTGVFVSAFARISGLKQTFDLTVSEPRFLDTRIVLTGEAHRREISYLGFRTRSELGGGARATFPLGAGFVAGAGIGAEYGGVVLYSEANGDPFNGPALVLGSDLLPTQTLRNPVRLSMAFDQRDSLLLPRNGVYADVSASYAGPFTLSGISFLDAGVGLKMFWTPIWGITLKSNTDVGGVVNPHGSRVPVTDRYFLGGLGSVRGYPALSIAPAEFLATTDGSGPVLLPIGGTSRFVQNLEVEFPLWPQTPFRGFVFLDAGNTYSGDELSHILAGTPSPLSDGIVGNEADGDPLGRIRQEPFMLFWSTGFGILIETPVLPFRFEWSVPLSTSRKDLQPISFFLGIGSAF